MGDFFSSLGDETSPKLYEMFQLPENPASILIQEVFNDDSLRLFLIQPEVSSFKSCSLLILPMAAS